MNIFGSLTRMYFQTLLLGARSIKHRHSTLSQTRNGEFYRDWSIKDTKHQITLTCCIKLTILYSHLHPRGEPTKSLRPFEHMKYWTPGRRIVMEYDYMERNQNVSIVLIFTQIEKYYRIFRMKTSKRFCELFKRYWLNTYRSANTWNKRCDEKWKPDCTLSWYLHFSLKQFHIKKQNVLNIPLYLINF